MIEALDNVVILLVLIFCYFLGSIPFGLLLAKYAGLGDIRKIGSGNIGATNVLRTGNKPLAIITLLLDIAKGYGAIALALWLLAPMPDVNSTVTGLAALAAVIGHMFPVWLQFKGGKGVATAFGTFVAINPLWALMLLIIWIGVAYAFRYSSLAALTASFLAPILGYAVFEFPSVIVWCVTVIVALIFWRHRANITRLLNGSETRILEKGGDDV